MASGSAFALAQSAGAAGIGVAGNAAIGGITAGITGTITALGAKMFVCFNWKSSSVSKMSPFLGHALLEYPISIILGIAIFSLNILVFRACNIIFKQSRSNIM